MKYHFKVHEEKDGYWAECIELEGCATQAETREELTLNMAEALNLYLNEPADSKILFPMPASNVRGKNIVEISVEANVAFALLLRQTRLKHNYTQKKVSELLGMKNIYNYQRLENPKTSNPALSTLVKLKKVLPDLDIEKVL